jgi:hypothetical protein
VLTNFAGPIGVNPGDTFELDLWAATGATATIGKVTLSVSVPQTNPPTSTTFDVWVMPQQSVDLAVTNTTLTDFFTTSTPWLVGQTSSVNVTVQNYGSAPSAGGDKLVVTVGGVVAGTATVPVVVGWQPPKRRQCDRSTCRIQSWPASSATLHRDRLPQSGPDANPSNNFGASA